MIGAANLYHCDKRARYTFCTYLIISQHMEKEYEEPLQIEIMKIFTSHLS